MLPIGETYLELLEGTAPIPASPNGSMTKGTGLFHICFEVEDIDAALAELKQKGVKLRDETPRPGHGGSRIAFIDPVRDRQRADRAGGTAGRPWGALTWPVSSIPNFWSPPPGWRNTCKIRMSSSSTAPRI